MDKNYGRLTILYTYRCDKNNRVRAMCRCECGNFKSIVLHDILRGHSKTCGKCKDRTTIKDNIHYKRAENIKSRCFNPNHTAYHYYGALGIDCEYTFIPDIVKGIESIPGYSPGKQLDRVDNSKGYYFSNHPIYGDDMYYSDDFKSVPCKGNLRWLTHAQNQYNKSNSIGTKIDNGISITRLSFRRWCKAMEQDFNDFEELPDILHKNKFLYYRKK